MQTLCPNPPNANAHTSGHVTLAASAWVQRWAHLLPPQAQVLDVACGSGRHMAYFQQLGHSPTGLDRDPHALACSAPYGRTVLADLENAPWPLAQETFDAVVVTHYLWRELFPNILNALKPGGILVYSTCSI